MGGAIFLLGYNYGMKTKLLTFLLAASFLFLFSGSVFGQKTEVKKEYWGEGKLKSEKHYKDGKIDGFFTIWHKNTPLNSGANSHVSFMNDIQGRHRKVVS